MNKTIVPCPKTIHCGAREYKLSLTTSEKLRGDVGSTDHKEGTSKIANDWVYGVMLESFFHEILHDVDSVYNWGQLSKDEALVDRIADGLAQVLNEFLEIDFSSLEGD